MTRPWRITQESAGTQGTFPTWQSTKKSPQGPLRTRRRDEARSLSPPFGHQSLPRSTEYRRRSLPTSKGGNGAGDEFDTLIANFWDSYGTMVVQIARTPRVSCNRVV